MLIFVTLSLFTLACGALMLCAPSLWTKWLARYSLMQGFHIFEITSRCALAIILYSLAEHSHAPLGIKVFSGICLLGAGALLVMGEKKHRNIAEWSMTGAKKYYPLMGLAALSLGLFLMYAAIGMSWDS